MRLERIGIYLLFIVSCREAVAQQYMPNKVKASGPQEYQLVKKSGGVELYETWYETKSGQQARWLKAVYTLDAPVDSVVALIRNGRRATEWNANTSAASVISRSEDSWIIYLRYNLPWPMDDQDCVLRYNVSGTPSEELMLEFESTEHTDFPEVNNVSRIPDVKGKWVLTPTPAGVKTTYYITTTPSSSLPRWITDPIIRNNLIDTMHAFRKILEGK